MPLTVFSREELLAVSLDKAKRQCRVRHTEEDEDIEDLIGVATDIVEGITWRCLIRSTLQLWLRRFPCGREPIVLPRPHCVSLTSVTYVDEGGTERELEGVVLAKRSEPATIVPTYGTSWPSTRGLPESVCVTYVAGYDDADEIPKAIKQAILMVLGRLYLSREDSIDDVGRRTAERLLSRHRCNDSRIADLLNQE